MFIWPLPADRPVDLSQDFMPPARPPGDLVTQYFEQTSPHILYIGLNIKPWTRFGQIFLDIQWKNRKCQYLLQFSPEWVNLLDQRKQT